MKQYQSIADLKNLAKDKLTGNFSNALFALLSVQVINRLISNMAVTIVPAVGIMWDIIALIISAVIAVFLGVLQTGVACYFLNLACGHRPNHGYIFYGFQESRDKSIRISLVHVLTETICLFPYQIIFLLFRRTTTVSYGIAALIALIVGYIILIPIKLAISQTYYLLMDFPESTPTDIIKTSIRIMKGHKKRLFLLELSFLPLHMLNLLSFGIGALWLNPYMQMTYTLFFLDLMNPGNLAQAKNATSQHES